MIIATTTPFLVLEGIDFHGWSEVEITVGVNPALQSRLQGTGIPCVLAWPPTQPGIILEVDPDQLIEAGFSEAEVWQAVGCEWGEYADPDNDQPVCEGCLSDSGVEREGRELPRGRQGVCWCCVANTRERFEDQVV